MENQGWMYGALLIGTHVLVSTIGYNLGYYAATPKSIERIEINKQEGVKVRSKDNKLRIYEKCSNGTLRNLEEGVN